MPGLLWMGRRSLRHILVPIVGAESGSRMMREAQPNSHGELPYLDERLRDYATSRY